MMIMTTEMLMLMVMVMGIETFRIASGTCSKLGRPPAYKPKTVFLY